MQLDHSIVQLTQNAVLYISSGFNGPYVLQIIACKLNPTHQYQLCLTDGRLYIGGRYQTTSKVDLPLYSVVKIQCKFISKWAPIQIVSLQIISTSFPYLLGKPPATLHDYFIQQKQSNQTSYNQLSQKSQSSDKIDQKESSRKKVKLSAQSDSSLSHQQSSPASKICSQTQKNNNYENKALSVVQNSQTQKVKFKFDSQVIVQVQSQQKNENIIPSQFQITQQKDVRHEKKVFTDKNQSYHHQQSIKTQTQPKLYIASDSQQIVMVERTKTHKLQTHNLYISDLYQRMMRWKILCRIINMRKFTSSKGKKCISLYLIDQKGDSIKAMYYYNHKQQPQADGLQEGKVYSFSGGEILQSNSDQSANLELSLDYKCQIQQNQNVYMYPFSQKKLCKFKQLGRINQQINLIGILKSFQILNSTSSTYKARPKIKGIICSPIQLCQIQFSKTLYEGEYQPIAECVYVFTNFTAIQNDNAIKLVSTHRSYLVQISSEDISYHAPKLKEFEELKAIAEDLGTDGKQWKKYKYTNLSEIKYTKRTVAEMKDVALSMDCMLYSEILVSIADIKLKKQYMACPTCKRATIHQEQKIFQCPKCRKIVNPVPTTILTVLFADGTGSIELSVIGDKSQIFLGIQSSQFNQLSPQQKQCTLQIAKFSQFAIKIKTEKKTFKQLNYTLQQAMKQELNLTMKQIRRRTVQKQLKIQQKWEIQN